MQMILFSFSLWTEPNQSN